MASLTLQLDGASPKEYGIPIRTRSTIRRLQDNAIAIDTPAVSSHHACVFRDGQAFVLEHPAEHERDIRQRQADQPLPSEAG